ncbi:MAG: MGMT family protein [Planctomycetota bacterium]|nr:MGMT family protein [Planctomycetota bacterium]MEC8651624.1 MGMT family protein [Planctomycetota bacterium]
MSPYEPARHGPRRIVGPGFHEQVFALVRQVPAGAVTTYGDVGAALGSKNVARHVGYAMAAVPADSDVPWWRVVAAGGKLSQQPDAAARQARLLAADDVEVRGARVRGFAQRRHVFTPSDQR